MDLVRRQGRRHPIRAALMLLGVLVAAFFATSAPEKANSAGDQPIKVKPGNPFYPVIAAFIEGGPSYGAVVDGCTIRVRTRCIDGDLNDATLTGAALSSSKLAGLRAQDSTVASANFAYSRLQAANLGGTQGAAMVTSYAFAVGSDFTGADLTFGALARSDFRGSSFGGATMFLADLSGSNLQNAELDGANLAGSIAAGTDLRNADLRGADLSVADLHKAKLDGAKLSGARFCNTIMPDGHIRNARRKCPLPEAEPATGPTYTIPPDLPVYDALKAFGKPPTPPGRNYRGCVVEPSARCRWANLEGAGMQGAFLSYSRLRFPDLARANLTFANLAFARLYLANLSHAKLVGAALVNARLFDARLFGADLSLANMAGARLNRSFLNHATAEEANLTGVDLEMSDLRGTDFSSSLMSGADLYGARLHGTNFSNVSLAGARVGEGFPRGAILCNTILPDGTVANPQRTC